MEVDRNPVGRLLSMLRKGDGSLKIQDDTGVIRIACHAHILDDYRSRRPLRDLSPYLLRGRCMDQVVRGGIVGCVRLREDGCGGQREL